MHRIFFICFTAIMLTGCITRSVIRESKDHDVDVPLEPPVLRLLSASIVEEQDGDDAVRQLHLYLCFNRLRPGQPQELVLARIATSYPFVIDGYPVLPVSNLVEGCNEPAGARVVRQLPIVETRVAQPATLPEGATDAIVTLPSGTRMDLDYAAATTGGYRPVTIDLSSLYFEHRIVHHEGRPYLLLLTPVTVVVDGAAIVAYAALWACLNGGCDALARVKYK